MSNMFFPGIAQRAVGEQFPLSIATELAIESVCGTHPDLPVRIPTIQKTDQLWINIRTLFRNIHDALDKETAQAIVPVAMAQVMLEEMDTIVSIIRQYSNGKAKVVFYFSNYKGIKARYKQARVREDITPKQEAYTLLINKTVENLLEIAPDSFKGFDLQIGDETSHNANTVIITHFAYDLLSYREFKELALLESHTGAIKERAQWYTKYQNGKDLAMMPFREDLLQVFGDSQTFHPMDIKLRKELIELAINKKWSATTTTDKIRSNLREMKNQFAAEMLRAVIK